MDGRREGARHRARVTLLGAVSLGFVIVDQTSKWWAWRHVSRVTVDIGGGVFDEFVGGLANGVMEDPLVGAVADAVLAALLVWAGYRLVSRERSRSVLLAGSALLAASASNLLDRLGLHSLTAPGSARGVVNWIGLGGGSVSPVNLADLLTTLAVLALGAAWGAREIRARVPARRSRAAAVGAAVLILGISLIGAAQARDGVRSHSAPPHVNGRRALVSTPATPVVRMDLGAPPTPASGGAWQDGVREIDLDGSTVTVSWASERVSVMSRSVLGWRADGVSAVYLHAVVVGPTTLEVYLPAQAGAALCLWHSLQAQTRGHPAVWECNAGTPPLRLRPTPVLFS